MWTQYLFTLAVAIVSFCILLYPLSPITLFLERAWQLPALAVCVIALGMAGLQYGLQRAVYIGGFCFNASSEISLVST
jgi:hypothetical protein